MMTKREFYSRVRKKVCVQPDGCWRWLGGRTGAYPKMECGEYGRKVHRAILAFRLGRKLAPGEVAMHLCDFKMCVNPRHIRLGTQAENLQSAHRKRRMHNPRVADPATVARIRRMRGAKQRDIAAKVGQTQTTVWKVLNYLSPYNRTRSRAHGN